MNFDVNMPAYLFWEQLYGVKPKNTFNVKPWVYRILMVLTCCIAKGLAGAL